jgi:hypothetical protein
MVAWENQAGLPDWLSRTSRSGLYHVFFLDFLLLFCPDFSQCEKMYIVPDEVKQQKGFGGQEDALQSVHRAGAGVWGWGTYPGT